MTSCPWAISSAASALSRRQLPQYIFAAPAVMARIFMRRLGGAVKEEYVALVNSLDDLRLEAGKRPHVAHAVPGIQVAGRLALGLIAFEKSRHEELARERRQANTSGFAVTDHAFRMIRIDHLNDG